MSTQLRYGMKKILVCATRNRHKIEELKPLLEPLGYVLRTLDEEAPHLPLREDGTTFAENAEQKALLVHHATGKAALADDSGLSVDALGGAPGVRSARYAAGPDSDSHDAEANNRKLLAELASAADRSARFRCALALVTEGGELFIAEGLIEGQILKQARGDGGFGYDPLFLPNGFDKTFAELSTEEKNRISHRRQALDALVGKLTAPRESTPAES